MSAKSSRAAAPRDMDASPFSAILGALIARIPGAYAAALVDAIGESVDYAGKVDPFDIKVAAATWCIVLRDFETVPNLAGVRTTLVMRGTRQSVIARSLPEHYAVIVLLRRRAGFAPSARALSACEHALAREANWTLEDELAWFAVTVECDARRRPVSIVYGGLEEPVEVLGTVRGADFSLGPHERGFRVRLASGPEITIIREPGDYWYAEERVTL